MGYRFDYRGWLGKSRGNGLLGETCLLSLRLMDC